MSKLGNEKNNKSDSSPEKAMGGALLKGTILKERYQINKVQGRGGFGITYRATDMSLQVDVAVKEVLYKSEEEMGRAMKEARIAASLYDLEGIVAVRDYFVENEIAYIVMEYVHGISVKQYIVQYGRMDGKEVLDEMKPLLGSIQKIHEKGIIHRDISVDNLMITKEGKIKLIDFGAASILNQNQEEAHTVLIKRGYAPIEQYRAEEKLGTWTDIYSLCATMYFMITGIVPQDAVERWLSDKLTSLDDICGTGLSRQQAQAIMKGMAVQREDRFQSLTALCDRLYGEQEATPRQLWSNTEYPTEQRLSGHTRTLRQEVSDFINGSQKNRHLPVIILAVCLVLLVGGTAIAVNQQSKKLGEIEGTEQKSAEQRTSNVSTATSSVLVSPLTEQSGENDAKEGADSAQKTEEQSKTDGETTSKKSESDKEKSANGQTKKSTNGANTTGEQTKKSASSANTTGGQTKKSTTSGTKSQTSQSNQATSKPKKTISPKPAD